MSDDARYARRVANLCGLAAGLMLLVLAASAFIRIEHNGCINIAFPATLSMMFRVMHRVAASAVGMLLLMVSFFVLHGRPVPRSRRALLVMLWVLTIFLAVLGRVTKGSTLPAIVMGNVVAGMALTALFWRLRLSFLLREMGQRRERSLCALAKASLSLVALQIWIGSWAAGLAATTDCRSLSALGGLVLWPDAAAWKALNPFAVVHGASPALLHALHWLTTLHAATAALLVATVAVFCRRLGEMNGYLRRHCPALLALLMLQLVLGFAMMIGGRILLAGVLHNVVAALMLAKLVDVHFRLCRN